MSRTLMILIAVVTLAWTSVAAAQGISVTLVPTGDVASDGQPHILTFIISGEGGVLASDAQITWSHIDKGAMGGCSPAGPGVLACTYTPPAGGPGGDAVLMIDITAGGQTISKHYTIKLAPSLGTTAVVPVHVVPAPAPAPVVTTTPAPPTRSYMKIASTPPSIVFIDGGMLGTTPIELAEIDPGDHKLTLKCTSCASKEEKNYNFTVIAGETYTLVDVAFVEAQPAPPEWVATPPAHVASTVAPYEPPTTTTAPPAPGYLTINTKPWSTVMLDDQLIGNTPLKNYATTAGSHTLTLKCGKCAIPQQETYTITVPANDSYVFVNLKWNTSKPEGAAAIAATTTTSGASFNRPGTPGQFPFTDQPYRFGKVMVRYPLVGYRYNQTASCDGDCTSFVDVAVAGPGGSGMVLAPASIGIQGELFPIEFVGIAVEFERFGYSTDASVDRDGEEDVFRDGINRINAGARFRLPFLPARANGPLDLIVDVGYAGQDFIYFRSVDANLWRYDNTWAHGVRFGGGLRFQAIPAVTAHAGWHGTGVAGGLISHEVAVGAQIRPWKLIVVDISDLLVSRSVSLANEDDTSETANITDLSTGVGISAGVVF